MIIKLKLCEKENDKKRHTLISTYTGHCVIHCNIDKNNNVSLVALDNEMNPIKLIPENEKLYSFTIYNKDTFY